MLNRVLVSLSLYFMLFLALALPQSAAALVILQYHHISEDTPDITSTSVKSLKAHLKIIESEGFDVVTLGAVTKAIKNKQPLPDKTVLLTFDDGYDTVYTAAYPLLKKRNWPFTVFVATDSVGKKGFATWDQLREMAKHGADIANHTTDHAYLADLKADESVSDWRRRTSKNILDAEVKIIEELDQNHQTIAYPYGEYSKALEQLVSDLGFVGFGQHSGAVGNEKTYVPRFPMGGDYGRDLDAFKQKLLSLPLPVTSAYLVSESGDTLADGILQGKASKPTLFLNLNESFDQQRSMTCFASQQGKLAIKQNKQGVWEIPLNKPVKSRRARFNCTAPAKGTNRFHWFSYPLVQVNVME